MPVLTPAFAVKITASHKLYSFMDEAGKLQGLGTANDSKPHSTTCNEPFTFARMRRGSRRLWVSSIKAAYYYMLIQTTRMSAFECSCLKSNCVTANFLTDEFIILSPQNTGFLFIQVQELTAWPPCFWYFVWCVGYKMN